MLGLVSFPSFALARTTVAFGTPIVGLINGRNDKNIKINKFAYTSGGTQHTLSFLRPKAKVALSASAAKGATTIVLASDPGAWGSAKTVAADPISSGDYIAYLKDDGTWEYNKLTGAPTVNADGTVSCPVSALGAAITYNAQGRYIYYFGVFGDSDPNTGLVHPSFAPTVSTLTVYDGNNSALVVGVNPGDPMLVYSGNATATGVIEYVNAVYGE